MIQTLIHFIILEYEVCKRCTPQPPKPDHPIIAKFYIHIMVVPQCIIDIC